MTNLSLYELIKKISQEKGRPLKIVCDYDECLQPVSPLMWWRVAKEKGWKTPKETFEEWFDYYWENARVEYKRNIPYTRDTTIKEIEEIRKRTDYSTNYPKDFDYLDFNPSEYDNEFNREVRTPQYKVLSDPNYYEEAPFLSIAEDLLKCLKEELINELVGVTASTHLNDSRKNRRFQKTFAKLPNTSLTIQKPGRFKERKEHRWEWIKNNHSDFDIFIDDSPVIIADAWKNLPSDKFYVMPNYKLNRFHIQDKDSIYFINNNLSDLKDQDFSIAALELKVKDLEKKVNTIQISHREREREHLKATNSLLRDYQRSSYCSIRNRDLLNC